MNHDQVKHGEVKYNQVNKTVSSSNLMFRPSSSIDAGLSRRNLSTSSPNHRDPGPCASSTANASAADANMTNGTTAEDLLLQ